MILIADAGSTKTRWIMVNNERIVIGRFESQGLNPTVFNKETMIKNIARNRELLNHAPYIKQIYFYGSGVDDKDAKNKMHKVLISLFDNAKIDIYSDMLAAARATAGNKPGIVSILGTGSNSAYYDGKEIVNSIGFFGYLLMDDASGNWFGKQLIRDYYFNKMPEKLRIKFKNKYKINKDDLIENLYNNPQPNTYLASFSPFMHKNYKSDYIKNLLLRGFDKFISQELSGYENHKELPLHFNGSIAYIFKKELLEILNKYSLKPGKIVKDPVEDLINYHL